MLLLVYNFKKYLNVPFSVIDSISKMKISKDVKTLIGINSQLDLINTYRAFHQKQSISIILFSCPCNICQDTLYVWL